MEQYELRINIGKGLRRAGILALGVLLLSGIGCNQLKARTRIRDAASAYQREDYPKACPLYEQALKLMPGDLELKRTLAFCYMAWYKPLDESADNKALIDKGAKLFREILSATPNDEKVREALLSLYLNANRYVDAISVLKNQLQKNPRDEELIKQIASLYLRAGELETAFSWYEKWSQAAPSNPEPWYTIGSLCWSKTYCEANRCEDPNLSLEKRQVLIKRGLDALQNALKVRSNHCETLAYMNLLYREKSKWTDYGDKKARDDDARLADDFRARAVQCIEARKKASGK